MPLERLPPKRLLTNAMALLPYVVRKQMKKHTQEIAKCLPVVDNLYLPGITGMYIRRS